MIAAIYARKSTDDSDRNEEGRSTTRQVERAAVRGWTVDPRYVFVDEAASGTGWKHRTGFNVLLTAVEPRLPSGVLVVSELSRIGRDTVRTPAAVLQLEEAGGEVWSYLSNAPISLADEASEIMTVVHSLAASFERRSEVGDPFVLRGADDRYLAYGQTEHGRWLFAVYVTRPGGRVRVLTARDMTEREKRLYRRKRKG